MKVLICDDESLARIRLVKLVESIGGYEVVAQAADGEEALQIIPEANPDIILLDIQMPGLSGISVATEIAKMKNAPAVIFCTAHDEYALDAFRASVIDYLLKPINKNDLEASLAKAARVNLSQINKIKDLNDKQNKKFLIIRNHRGVERIEINRFIYFYANQKYVSAFYDDNKEVILDMSLRTIERELEGACILIRRNTLVMKERIIKIRKTLLGKMYVHLTGISEPLEASRRYYSALKRSFDDL